MSHQLPGSIPKLIIDTDPGIDDCVAILFALGLEKVGALQLLALTTVAGNVPLSHTQKNARIICDFAERSDVPVYAGADAPLLKSLVTATDVHGNTGLGDKPWPEPKTPLQNKPAVQFLIDTLTKAEPHSITLCAIGPLTNIALAIKSNPNCIKGIKELVIMGGAYFTVGNISPNAEFNFFIDPIATKIVLNTALPMCVFPLDVTLKARVTDTRLNALKNLANENGPRMAYLLNEYERWPRPDSEILNPQDPCLHDPCTIAYVVRPDLFTSKKVFADIETNAGLMEGAVQVDWQQRLTKEPNVSWHYDIHTEKFFDLLLKTIATLP